MFSSAGQGSCLLEVVTLLRRFGPLREFVTEAVNFIVEVLEDGVVGGAAADFPAHAVRVMQGLP